VRTVSAATARRSLYRLIDAIARSGEPLRVVGPRSSAVLVSEADWRGIEETLYLLSVPGMRESIHQGLQTSSDECSDHPGW
jgi:PHD/YefM family antitoxin component YafN of YafNO toxin-antitoxin module